jgi:hypothetical protein
VKVSRHNDKGIDPQTFFLYTEIQALRNNFASGFVDEYGQPFKYGEGDIIQSHVSYDAIAFHVDIIFAPGRPSVFISARSEAIAEPSRQLKELTCRDNSRKRK